MYLSWCVPTHASHSRRPCFTFTDTLTHKTYCNTEGYEPSVIFVKSVSRSSVDCGISTALLNFGIHDRLYDTQLVVADVGHCDSVQTLKPYLIAINFNIILRLSIACIKQQIKHRTSTSDTEVILRYLFVGNPVFWLQFLTPSTIFLQIATSWTQHRIRESYSLNPLAPLVSNSPP
jgi:hypothetical protein